MHDCPQNVDDYDVLYASSVFSAPRPRWQNGQFNGHTFRKFYPEFYKKQPTQQNILAFRSRAARSHLPSMLTPTTPPRCRFACNIPNCIFLYTAQQFFDLSFTTVLLVMSKFNSDFRSVIPSTFAGKAEEKRKWYAEQWLALVHLFGIWRMATKVPKILVHSSQIIYL